MVAVASALFKLIVVSPEVETCQDLQACVIVLCWKQKPQLLRGEIVMHTSITLAIYSTFDI